MATPHDHQALLFSTITTEIGTGLALSRVALSSNDPDKVARNTANARLAYDTARRWVRKLNPADSKVLDSKFKELKANLGKLEKKST